jgi:hypothetical protein
MASRAALASLHGDAARDLTEGYQPEIELRRIGAFSQSTACGVRRLRSVNPNDAHHRMSIVHFAVGMIKAVKVTAPRLRAMGDGPNRARS